MNKKLILSILALTLFSLFFINLASASVSFAYPTSSSTVSGTTRLNVTNATADTLVNCTFYAKSASTANSSWSSLGFASNDTDYKVNLTWSSLGLEDANDYTLNATCRNNSNGYESATITSVRINNTSPDAASSISPTAQTLRQTAGTINFSIAVSDSNTTACTYTISRGGGSSGSDYYSGTADYNAATCAFTKTFSGEADNGLWYWSITATDGNDQVPSTPTVYQVAIPAAEGSHGGGGGSYVVVEKKSETQSNATTSSQSTSLWASIVNFFKNLFN